MLDIEESRYLINGRSKAMPEERQPPPGPAPSESTESEDHSGKAGAETRTLTEMLPLVYDELRRLAAGYLRNERPEHTLQRTALVHEAYLRLAGEPNISLENPAHLLGIFARLMRQTLINHAVARTRAKRGGDDPTNRILEFYERHEIDIAAVDEALRELEELDLRQARIVELRFFAGLTIEEIAKLLEISPATVKREWTMAKLWLRKALEPT
jgi:RNA polymerase sigma factor (TIGR02999 family)